MNRVRYTVIFTSAFDRSLRKFLDRLSKEDAEVALSHIATLEDNPRGKYPDRMPDDSLVSNRGHKHHLKGNLRDIWSISLGVGKYRLLYAINDRVVEVLGIALSKNHYDDLSGQRGKFIKKTARDFLSKK